MSKKKAKKNLVAIVGGEAHEITGENGRYWICGDKQFRKSAVTVEEKPKESEGEPEDE